MNITEISVSYEETCSLPGYSNVRPGVRVSAQIEPEDDHEHVREFLMDGARDYVHQQIDQALIDNDKAPKYFSGPRYRIVVSNQRKIILVVPHHRHDLPDDFYQSVSSNHDLQEITLDQAERYARDACDHRDGYKWEVILDGDYSILPSLPGTPLPGADGLADEGDYPDDMELDEE